jgi:ABC-2 type transport system permease protein
MIELRRSAAILLRQFYLLRGSPARVFPMFAWVAIDIVLWGFITKYLSGLAEPGFKLVPALLGAVLLWDFLARVMQGVTMAFFEDVWSRNFLNVFATPLRISEYLIGLVATSICTSLVGLAVMLAVATFAFGLSFLSYGSALLPFLMILFLTGIALGVFASGVVLRLGPASEWLIWPIPTLISPFVGVFYPLSVLPGWMQAISKVLAPAYVFEGMRAVVAGKGAPTGSLAWGGALTLVYLVLACAFFWSVHRYAIRTGLIARYSAESVS